MDTSSTSQGFTAVQVDVNTTPKHFKLTYEKKCQFLELLLTEDRMGNRVGGTFTGDAYRNILAELQITFGATLRKNQLRNMIRSLKQHYSEFKDAFRGMNGFSWNWHSKKFDAEDEVWKALIKDNPAAASLRHKTCQHWDIMNSLWSSSRTIGFEASTMRERCVRVQQQIEDESIESPSNRHRNNYNLASSGARGFEVPQIEGMDTTMPDASNSQPYTCSDNGKFKRKANVEEVLESVGNNLSASLDNLSRAIVESTELLANKLEPSSERSKNLFDALLGLDLSKEYLIRCYAYMNKHEAEANMFLGLPADFRREMLAHIMTD